MYNGLDQLLQDLAVCGSQPTCMGCSQEGKEKKPECYRRVMQAAAAELEERANMVKRLSTQMDELVDDLWTARQLGINGIRMVLELTRKDGWENWQ